MMRARGLVGLAAAATLATASPAPAEPPAPPAPPAPAEVPEPPAPAEVPEPPAPTEVAEPAELSAPPEPAARTRPVHWSIGVGGYGALTGPARAGPAVELELYPGLARMSDRLGVGLFARDLGDAAGAPRTVVTAGACYEVGAARPRLAMALRGELGLVLARGPWRADAPAAAVGLRVTLAVAGPLAVGVSTTATVLYDGVDSSLAIATAGVLGFAR